MGRISKIEENDIVNGAGISVSVWFQGCPHHCKDCFNPDTWDFNKGIVFTKDTIKNILDSINKNGVTRNLSILGGESLCPQNIDSTLELCKEIKKTYPNILIRVWTGYLYEEVLSFDKGNILQYIDILVDGKFEIDKKDLSLRFKGSRNQRVIDVKESIKQNIIILWKD